MNNYIVEYLNNFTFGFKHIYDNLDLAYGTELTYIVKNGYLIKVRYRSRNHRGYIDCHYPLPLFTCFIKKYKNCIIYVDVDKYVTTATFEYFKKDGIYGNNRTDNKRRTNRDSANI